MQQQQIKKNACVNFILKHKYFRTFFFQFILCVFLVVMCLGVTFTPPFQGHPHDVNVFKLIYVALIVYSIICFGGPITGAHINPAITLAHFVSKKYQKGDVKLIGCYLLAEFLGCWVGCIMSKNINDLGGPVYVIFPDMIDLLKDMTQEMVGTFLLVMFVMIINHEETTFVYGEAWGHLMVGAIYYFCLTFSTNFHILNPAIITGLQFQGMLWVSFDASTLGACALLILAQLLGAFLGQAFFTKAYLPRTIQWKKSFK